LSQNDKIFFKERGFGKKLGFGKQACLIVVDMIVGFTDQSMPMGYELSSQIKKINRIIEVSRSINIPIMFTTISYSDSTIEKSNIWSQKMKGLTTLKSGTRAIEVDPRLDFRSSDDLIIKKYASAFFGSDLITRMNTVNADTLIVTGCTTSGCVRATVVDAVQYGYRPIVVEDAVGDRSENSHNQSIFDMEQKYADVISTKELLESLSLQLNS
jgi:nicotinamidase-related amidase